MLQAADEAFDDDQAPKTLLEYMDSASSAAAPTAPAGGEGCRARTMK
jgi:hypothetical protein